MKEKVIKKNSLGTNKTVHIQTNKQTRQRSSQELQKNCSPSITNWKRERKKRKTKISIALITNRRIN